MQYSLRKISKHLDEVLRRRARREGKSLNQVALEALSRGAGIGERPVKQRNLSDLAGRWREDPKVDEALEAQRAIDPGLWR